MNIPMWDIIGSTMVTNNYIRLTSDHQSKSGGIWNSQVNLTFFFPSNGFP